MINARSSGGLLLLAWLAISAVLTATQFRDPGGVLNDVQYLLVAGGLAVAAWLGAVRLRGADRPVGFLLAAGLTSSSIGDLISIVTSWWQGAEPEASAADVGWLGAYVGIGGGLFLLLRRGTRGQRRDIDGLIDVGAVFVAGTMVIWQVAIEPTLSDPSLSVWVRVVWGLYPVMDIAVLALLLRLVVRDRNLATLLIAGGAAMWLVADFAYLMVASADSYSIALDAGWLWGGILIALAVLYGPGGRARGDVVQQEIDRVGLGRILVAMLPLLIPVTIEVIGYTRGQEPNPWLLFAGTAVLVLFAFARMVRLAASARGARAALESRKRYASALAANSSDAVVVVDSDLLLVESFPQLAVLVGYPGRDSRGRHLLSMVAPEDLEETRAALIRCLASPGQIFDMEVRVRHGGGGQIWLAARVVNLLDDPDVQGIVVNLHDITRRKRAEEELGYQAFHDALTGLANRALFRDRLNHALDRSAGTGTEPAVIFLDLDGFKTINDSLGHDAGDDLLREVAGRFLSAVRKGDTVGRLGGDEFAILIEQSHRPLDQAIAVAERLLQALRDPVRLGDQSVTVSASLGLAVGNGASSAALLRDADIAMYRSKATGKARWTAYSPGMRTAALERLELENGLHVAVARNELRLHYQPVVALETEQVVGFEALLRWQHPRHGLLQPDRFIPLAEETGLIVPIGRWVLHEATATAARWQHQFQLGRQLTMAVNLSARQLTAPDLVDDVTHALTTSGLDPGDLVLEMTETVLVQDAGLAAARLQDLHRLGVRLAIDDFGTGYSSLSYLRQFPIDILKIDRTFVSTITDRDSTPAIVRGLLDLGRTLQLETVAEGVELDLQRARLRAEHCALAQGFLFARPLPAEAAERLLGELDITRTLSASEPGGG